MLGEDFLEPDPIVFDSSSTVNATKCTSITITDDQALEGIHHFSVHILSSIVVSVVGQPYATVNIHDNDSKIIVCYNYTVPFWLANYFIPV